ncbi:MAG: 1-acyl-sn-glycerol-3-phosphate acyltransferase [Clostridiales Family XIII bacterium]|jgi:1-acyl-sn-glycerol-3-phosphate acyltransferase|nr:1-acyl-sn-glycerol-3-phosphate acyltransferase [Clostridiales Family XIII bacterium]
MNILKIVPFAFWMFSTLPPIRTHRREIDKYRAAGDFENEQEWIRKAENVWGPLVLRHYGIAVDVGGNGNLPDGPVLFVSNHEGFGDIVVFMDAIRTKQFGFVAKDELGRVPIFGTWIRRIRSLMLERDDPREAVRVFKTGEEWLRQGFSLVIFPEGTRALNRGMAAFNRGSLRMAMRTGVPIVPISIRGTWRLFEEKGGPRRGTARFFVHPTIETKGLAKTDESALSDRIEEMIRKKIDEWIQEEHHG